MHAARLVDNLDDRVSSKPKAAPGAPYLYPPVQGTKVHSKNVPPDDLMLASRKSRPDWFVEEAQKRPPYGRSSQPHRSNGRTAAASPSTAGTRTGRPSPHLRRQVVEVPLREAVGRRNAYARRGCREYVLLGKYVAGGILTFLTIALSLLVPLRWGLSRAQFHPRVEWLLPGAVCGISVAVTGAKAGRWLGSLDVRNRGAFHACGTADRSL